MNTNCPNCGAVVQRNYCPECGQERSDAKPTLWLLLGSFFTEFLSFDGKHARTAASLFVPGRLTQLYLEGKRASHSTPVRVYFVASLLFFLLVGIPVPDAENFNVYIDDILVGREEPQPGLATLQLFSLDRNSALGKAFSGILDPKLEKLTAMDAQELLNVFISGVERNVPTVLIFFVPVLALVLKILYIRRGFLYVTHLVFALHFQSFLFVGLVLCHLLNLLFLSRLWPVFTTYLAAILLVFMPYFLIALRRVYGQGWIRSIAKCLGMGFIYVLLLVPTLMATLFLVVGRI